MRQVLGLPPGVEARSLNTAANQLLHSLQSNKGIELSIVSALWVDRRIALAPNFVNLCSECFHAVAETLDMKNPASAGAINKWAAEKTRGKISTIVSAESIAATATLIANAVYFKGKFLFPFRKEATQPRPFHLALGREKLVPMMQKTGMRTRYRTGKRCEAAALRYSGGEANRPFSASAIELILVLPERGVSPEAILKEDLFALFRDPEEWVELELLMPRFNVDFEARLNQPLTQMGMGIAMKFPGADFVPMGSELFFIDTVVHKTRLEMDEEGTTAAAATTGDLVLGSSMVQRQLRKKTLVFDRPFAVLLRDTANGALLFAGVVYEP